MFKKTVFFTFAMLLLLALILTACSGGFKESYEELLDDIMGKVDIEAERRNVNAEELVRERIEEYSKGKAIWFKYEDFDGDGIFEAFAFVGKAGAEFLEGTLWFANENYAMELAEDGKWLNPEIITVSGTNFMFSENYDDGLTYVFGVEGSKGYSAQISGMFSNLEYMGGVDFTADFTSYDYYEDEELAKKEEPSTKKYWFYLKDGVFCEYGADDSLRRADLRKYDAGSKVIDTIYKQGLTDELLKKYYADADEGTLDFIADEAGYFHNIMLRENGIMNLNFFGAYEDCFYITFKITGEGKAEIIDSGRGFYADAAVPAIATYPTKE